MQAGKYLLSGLKFFLKKESRKIELFDNATSQGTIVEPSPQYDSGTDLRIGASENHELWFNGTIDDVRIYYFALSDSQITQLYLDTKDGYSSSQTIVSAETIEGEVWQCEVTPTDETYDGETKQSNNLTIEAAVAPAPPNDPPTWSNNKTNASATTETGDTVYFNVTIADDDAGGYYIFSFYNGSAWVNDSAVAWTNETELTETRTITAPMENLVRWYWWFNDTIGNSNQTDIWSFVVYSPPTYTVDYQAGYTFQLYDGTDVSTYGQTGVQSVYIWNDTESKPAGTLVINFSAALDNIVLPEISSAIDAAGGKGLFHNLSAYPAEVTVSYVLVPVTTGNPYHCPKATSLADISTACTDVDLSPSYTTVTLGGKSYYKISNQGGGNGGGEAIPEFNWYTLLIAAVMSFFVIFLRLNMGKKPR